MTGQPVAGSTARRRLGIHAVRRRRVAPSSIRWTPSPGRRMRRPRRGRGARKRRNPYELGLDVDPATGSRHREPGSPPRRDASIRQGRPSRRAPARRRRGHRWLRGRAACSRRSLASIPLSPAAARRRRRPELARSRELVNAITPRAPAARTATGRPARLLARRSPIGRDRPKGGDPAHGQRERSGSSPACSSSGASTATNALEYRAVEGCGAGARPRRRPGSRSSRTSTRTAYAPEPA